MQMAVAGGTGTLGREVVRELEARGHRVRVLSRRSTTHPVDLTTGEGLDAALAGVDGGVDAANARPARQSAEALLIGGTQRLLAAEAQAGVAHHVGVSIVGIDRVPMGYYEVKLAQEAVVSRGAVPWSMVRATQFHALLDWAFRATARAGVVPGAPMPLQPCDPSEVAAVLADTAEAEPSRATTQFAGPEIRTLGELAREWRAITGRRALVVGVPLIGRTGRALRAGGLVHRGAWSGRVRFAAYLRARYAPAAADRTASARRLGGTA